MIVGASLSGQLLTGKGEHGVGVILTGKETIKAGQDF